MIPFDEDRLVDLIDANNIVPKGLRSFDEHDAHFFPELLSGPRDCVGRPESLRFWNDRIEETDPSKTFAVGVLYGLSGCGKSSLIKAGLIPSISGNIVTVYVEATPNETERRLLSVLRTRCQGIAKHLCLNETLAALRGGETDSGKVLIVLDQFEQWLQAKTDPDEMQKSELVEALRHCDGDHVQCLVIVRDDFWTATTRFMRALGVRLIDGGNSNVLEPFPMEHARKILTAFGRAFGALPHENDTASSEQTQFVDEAARGLAEGGCVIPVRLALFAEMMKGKPWIPATLNRLMGTEEVGVAFLETTFGATSAPPIPFAHQRAALAILKKLLPETGTDIKGNARSYSELLNASGYHRRLQDFDELIRILDRGLRLITPLDPEVETADEDSIPLDTTAAGSHRYDSTLVVTRHTSLVTRATTDASQRCYRLTHDYLVPSLRKWLIRKQMETRRGRAELKLADRAAMWNARNDTHLLPTLAEFLSIRLLTDRRQWTEPQGRMMSQAGLRQVTFSLGLVLLVVIIGFTVQSFVSRRLTEQLKAAVDAVQDSSAEELPDALRELRRLPREMTRKELETLQTTTDGNRRLRLAFGLAEVGAIDPVFLCSQIETTSPDEADNLIVALGRAREASLNEIQTAAAKSQAVQSWLLKGRLALIALYLGEDRIASDMCRIEDRPDPIQRTCFIEAVTVWPGDVTKLAAFARKTDNRALRSGLCLGLAGISPEKITDDARPVWQPLFIEWLQFASDSLTHGAARLAIFYWGLEIPELAAIPNAAEGRDWRVNSVGMILNRIPPNPSTAQVITNHAPANSSPFFLSDREVTIAQFGLFLTDNSNPNLEKPKQRPTLTETDPSFPVHSVNWYDAVMFCNWLSHQERLTLYYEKTGTRDPSGNEEWRGQSDANGYRLPTEGEWEHACRAGTTTTFSCGDGFVLSRYGNVVGASLNPCALRFPNGWGLFDMHGNVCEWCDDSSPDSDDLQRTVRGGSWTAPVASAASAFRSQYDPGQRSEDVGFRVALPSAAHSPLE